MRPLRLTILATAAACVAAYPSLMHAQGQPASSAPASAPAAPAQNQLKPEQLEQLLAPIALYPDNLLAQVLMASTYPLEVVEASRWAEENKNLKGDALKSAAEAQSWDDSVKGLVLTPSVLNMMSTKLSWTQKLGDAMLAQQPDVMDAVQRLRSRAQAEKKLETTKEQKVSVRTEQNKQVIVIEPATPDTLYVPYYNPSVVYGAWPYTSYPPYYFPPAPGYYAGAALATGLAFGAGVALGAWASNNWGNSVNWGNNNINVNRSVNINNARVNQGGNWQHNPAHRQGVRYNNPQVAQRYGKGDGARGGNAGVQNRADFRGRDGQQVLKPDGGQRGDRAGDRGDRGGNAGDRGGQRGDRAGNAGDRGGQRGDRAGDRGGQRADRGGGSRPQAANRAGGGNRAGAMDVGGGARNARAQSARGNASLGGAGLGGGGRGGGGASLGGGGRGGGGGAGMRAGGGGGGGGRGGGGGGGGRRSDINLKHDVVLLGHLGNGLGFYRFSYNGSEKPYVGVIAQEVQTVRPDAVTRGPDGYLRVRYEKIGVPFQTYDHWVGSGAHIPAVAGTH